MNRSGQITVTTAGTAQQGTDVGPGYFFIQGHPDNTGNVWVGNVSEDVSNANGFSLAAGSRVVLYLTSLANLWFDVDTNGEKVCWIWSPK